MDFVYIPGRGVRLDYVPGRGSRFMFWRSGKMCSAPAKYVSIDSIELGMFGLSKNFSTLLRASEIFFDRLEQKKICLILHDPGEIWFDRFDQIRVLFKNYIRRCLT